MIYDVLKKTFDFAPVNLKEVFRYAGAKEKDEKITSLIESCVNECEDKKAVNFSVCYVTLPVFATEDTVNFSAFELKSKNLSTALKGANSAIIFACTIGIGIDRLIEKYSELNPSRALIFQALGAERVETFIDLFLSDYSEKNGLTLTPRFSPGYGDLAITTQKDIFALLNPQKLIGLTLNESLLMSPSKSVTAIAGIKKHTAKTQRKEKNCDNCEKQNCEYRR